jgi:superoxide dismutase, Cu-Zn family
MAKQESVMTGVRMMMLVMAMLLVQAPVFALTAVATLADAAGKSVGSVTMSDVTNGIVLSGSFTGLSGTEQAVHVHTVGLCEGPKFVSAKGHWNPAMRMHGFDNPKGAHRGDMPNLRIGKKGTATLTSFIGGVSLADLLDADGASVIIHAGPDDYVSDPAGNSGDRVACGVVMAKIQQR